jgi:hypothetical protein
MSSKALTWAKLLKFHTIMRLAYSLLNEIGQKDDGGRDDRNDYCLGFAARRVGMAESH